MPDDVRYKPDRKGTGGLLKSPEMRGLVELRAYEAIPFADAISPDAPPYGEGYRNNWKVTTGQERIAHSNWRAVAYLSNESSYAAAVEWGNRGNFGHHVLAKVLDHIEGVI